MGGAGFMRSHAGTCVTRTQAVVHIFVHTCMSSVSMESTDPKPETPCTLLAATHPSLLSSVCTSLSPSLMNIPEALGEEYVCWSCANCPQTAVDVLSRLWNRQRLFRHWYNLRQTLDLANTALVQLI